MFQHVHLDIKMQYEKHISLPKVRNYQNELSLLFEIKQSQNSLHFYS